MTNKINNGDLFDIGQTVNGCNAFIYINNKWHYYYDSKIQQEYEYDQNDLTNLVLNTDGMHGEAFLVTNIK